MASLWESEEGVFSLTFYCHLLENCHDDYINLENYRTYESIVGLAFFGPSTFVQCPTYTTVHGGPVLTILELYQRWPLSASGPELGTAPHSLQLRSSDWSSQSASPSQRQPALMHRPLSHINSPERQGWWEAGETCQASVFSQSAHAVSHGGPGSHSPGAPAPPC